MERAIHKEERLSTKEGRKREGEEMRRKTDFSPIASNMIGFISINQPFPILHPNTPHAFPFARTSSGKIYKVVPNISINDTHSEVRSYKG